MNIFDILNSQFVSQTQYDTIIAQQKAYQQYYSQLQSDPNKIAEIWPIVRQAGILDICYENYKYFAKENKLSSLEPIQKLMSSALEEEGKIDYLADFVKFMGIKQDYSLFDQVRTVVEKYELEYDIQDRLKSLNNLNFKEQYQTITIELLKLYAEKVYSEEGFLNELLEFGAALESIEPLAKNIIQQVHADRTIKNMFEAVLYYPDTSDHLHEFKSSMEVTKMYANMDSCLQQQMKKRLLISGVNTDTILKFYVNLLKVLQFVDSDYMVFDKVTKPIKEYLLQRSDFLRCIIGILTQQNYSTDKVMIFEQQDSSDEESSQEKDLTSVLVSLYGSQEAFISEYQNMVAEKILTPKDFSLEQEIANIELMKIRFGEQSMNTCSIMMKDIYESKRIDTNIQSLTTQFNMLKPLFLSKTFWPISYEFKPTFKLPPAIEQLFNDYQKRFEKIKTMRSLLWHHDLGSVTLDLTFDNGDFEFKCLPIHACIIGYFNDDDSKGLYSDALAQQLQMNHEDLKRRMQFWVQKGVIREQKGENDVICYTSVKIYVPQSCDDLLIEEIPEDLFVSSTNFLQSNQLIQQISHNLIELLKQTGTLKIEKIVQLFKTTFKSEFSTPITENNIKEAIKILIQKGKLQGSEYIELKQ
ncbi:unnamed protein product (macronuclear) [Paramecium tetraurelia]|uniref:Cullin family profile domain-containing protein n=1 Tax=Paramecium tetraurelia TaxID=5888 RepID=A0BKZ0_PARTE|nr:uncharacterized protein GSPATT00029838001 [Paramecium tetraurelia]CAK59207.1 unnamed protein product [Paramecium tetraurelia]|eukprot:XP_001426605.1 hypothetical protein (macronuclear) [Paramecium tetraurelia strain d4-2]